MTISWKKEDKLPVVEKIDPITIEEPTEIYDIEPPEPEIEDVVEDSVLEPLTEEPIQRYTGKPIDLLYKEYAVDKFAGIQVDVISEPELAKFIEQNKDKARFNNYSQDALTYYARRIYELRKNNSNNTAG